MGHDTTGKMGYVPGDSDNALPEIKELEELEEEILTLSDDAPGNGGGENDAPEADDQGPDEGSGEASEEGDDASEAAEAAQEDDVLAAEDEGMALGPEDDDDDVPEPGEGDDLANPEIGMEC
jgi:hypothetical protein